MAVKDLVKLLILGGALSVMASAAAAKPIENLHCNQPKCVYEEEMDGGQTTTFNGYCDGENSDDFTMACHPQKGMTCLGASPGYKVWSCMCTNWATHKQAVTVDLYCAK